MSAAQCRQGRIASPACSTSSGRTSIPPPCPRSSGRPATRGHWTACGGGRSSTCGGTSRTAHFAAPCTARAGEIYTTTVYFAPGRGPLLEFEQSLCSCPVAVDCKHAVALTLKAADPATGSAARPTPPSPRPQAMPWQRSLESLLEGRPGGTAGQPGGAPLAIELTLSPELPGAPARGRGAGPAAAKPPPSLLARLVRPGKHGGWVGGSLSWAKLDALRTYGEHPAAQVRLLQEIYALYRSRGSQSLYYSYGDGQVDRPVRVRVPPALAAARRSAAVGLRLVYGRKLGAVDKYRLRGAVPGRHPRDAGGAARLISPGRSGVDGTECRPTERRSGSSAPRATASSTSTRAEARRAPTAAAGASGWPGSPGRSRAAAARWRWRPAAGGSGRRAGQVPRRLLPAAAAGWPRSSPRTAPSPRR